MIWIVKEAVTWIGQQLFRKSDTSLGRRSRVQSEIARNVSGYFFASDCPKRQPNSRPASQPNSRPTNRPTDRPNNRTGSPGIRASGTAATLNAEQMFPQVEHCRGGVGAGNTVIESLCNNQNQPAGQPTHHMTGRLANRPTELAKRPTDRPGRPGQPTNLPTDRPTRPTMNRPTDQPTDQPSNRPRDQPTDQPICRPPRSLDTGRLCQAQANPTPTFQPR